jgi:hypothetical protein
MKDTIICSYGFIVGHGMDTISKAHSCVKVIIGICGAVVS